MVEINADPVSPGELAAWYKMQTELSALKSAEALLRGRIYRHFFKEPKEGTNNFPLEDGTGAVLKAQRKIDRSVDQGALEALRKTQADALLTAKEHGLPEAAVNFPLLNFDTLVKWKPEVSITEYRKLTAEEANYFEQCLIIKDGSPQLEIVIPKRVSKT